MSKKVSFMDLASKVFIASGKNKDVTVSAIDLIEGYSGGSKFSVEDGEFMLSKQGFRQLGQHIGFPAEAIAKLDGDPGLQQTVLRHVVAGESDKVFSLRVTGNNITDILSGEHVLLKNASVIMKLQEMIGDAVLPSADEIEIGPHYVSPDGRQFSARIMAPDIWSYNIGNGRRDPVHGAMFVRNDERGKGAFVCGAAIARIACFNWTLGKFQMSIIHRNSVIEDFYSGLGATAGLIGQYSGEIAEEIKSTRSHRLERPELVFEKVAQRLGIPAWAMTTGRNYLDQETNSETVFDVVQAITRMSQEISVPGGRRKPKWGLRETVEQNVLIMAQEIISGGEEAFVVTVGDVIDELRQYDTDSEAIGFSPIQQESRGREVIINQ